MKKIFLNLIFFLILLPSCYHIKFDNEFKYLNSLTTERTNLPVNLFTDCCYEEIEKLFPAGISRDDAIEIALKNNKNLQATFESLGAVKSDLVQANLFTNPTLKVGAFFPNLIKAQNDAVKGLTDTEIITEASFRVSDLWQLPLKANFAKDQVELQVYNILNEILETIKITREAYDEILYSKAYIDYGMYISSELKKIKNTAYYKENEEERDKNKKLENNIKHFLLEVQIAKLNFNIIAKHRATLLSNFARLKKAMGIKNPTSKKIKIKDDLFNICLNIPNIENLLEIAHKNHPDIYIAMLKIKAAQDQLKLEEARIVKDVEIGVNAAGPDPILSGAGPLFASEIPILDQNQAQKARAYYEMLRAQKEFEAVKLRITADVYSTYEDLIGGKDKVDVYKNLLGPSTKKMLEAIDNLKGEAASLETVYINLQFDVYDILLSYIDGLKEFIDKHRELERALGKRFDVKFDPNCRIIQNFKKKEIYS